MGKVLSLGTIIAALGLAPVAYGQTPKPLPQPITLTTQDNVSKPEVAVDDGGTGHFVWTEDVSGVGGTGDDVLHYCQVPRGATACTKPQQWTLKNEAFARSRVLVPGDGRVILLTERCCGTSSESVGDDPTYAVVSSDGGTTFAAPKAVGNHVPPSGEGVLGPGSFATSTITDVVTEGTLFQSQALDGYTAAYANLSEGGGLKSYYGSIGFTAPTVPIAAYGDLDNTFWRVWSGMGDINSIASWGPEQMIPQLDEPKLASGPRGVYLFGLTDTDGPRVFNVRRFNGSGWDAPQDVTPAKVGDTPIFRDVYQDTGGNIAITYLQNREGYGDRVLVYRVSTDGKTFRPEILLGGPFGDAYNLQMASAKDGGGFVVYDKNSKGPIRATVIPPISAQGGGGSGGGAGCPGEVSFNAGKVLARAITGCLQKQSNGTYTTDDAVRVNGLDIVPAGATGTRAQAAATAKITVDPAHRKISASGNVTTKAGNVVLDKGSFSWTIPAGSGQIHVSSFADLGKFKFQLLGFPIVGTGELNFTDKGTTVDIHLQLPKMFGGVSGEVKLRTDTTTALGLRLDNLHINVGSAFIGALQVKNLDVLYNAGLDTFEGSAQFLLPPAYAQPGVKVAFGLKGGDFAHAEATVGFNPPLPISEPFVSLYAVGLALKADPLTINGGVGLNAGPNILGQSAAQIDALPPEGLKIVLSDPAEFSISGKLRVVSVPVASGFVKFRTDGLLSFGGALDYTLPLGIARVFAGIPLGPPDGPAFIDFKTGKFNAVAKGSVCIPAGCGAIDIGAVGVMSSVGFAACGEYLISKTPEIGVSAGFGYKWGEGPEVFADLGGCDVGGFKASLRGLRQGGATSFAVKAGLPQVNAVIQGAGGAPPSVTVALPNGEVLAPDGEGRAQTPHAVMFRSGDRVHVLVGQPPAGTYTVTPLAGSAPIASVKTAEGLPDPAVTGKVGGKRYARRLSYTIKPIAGQVVRFVERSGAVGADLPAVKGSKGTVRFTPADGAGGTRQIVALVEQNGVPRRQIVVATHTAPPPRRAGKPRWVRVKRFGASLQITWGPAARAKRYVVRVTLKNGRRLQFVSETKRRLVKVPGVRPEHAGRITVAGLRNGTKAGPARAATLKPVKKKRRRR